MTKSDEDEIRRTIAQYEDCIEKCEKEVIRVKKVLKGMRRRQSSLIKKIAKKDLTS